MRICLYIDKGIYVYIIFNLYIYIYLFLFYMYIYIQKHQHLPTARPQRKIPGAHVFSTSEAHVGVQNGIDELCDHLLSRGTHLPQLIRGKGEPGPLEIAALLEATKSMGKNMGNIWKYMGNIWKYMGYIRK